MKSINLNYRAGKNTKVGTPTLPEAMERAVGLMAPDRHVANRVIILVSAVYRSTDIQSVKGDPETLDIEIVSLLKHESVEFDFSLADFHMAFVKGLNNVAIHCMQKDNDPENYQHVFNASFDKIPVLFDHFNANENVVVEVFRRYHDSVSSCIDFLTPDTNECLLHILIRKRMAKAIAEMVSKYEISHLFFTKTKTIINPSAQSGPAGHTEQEQRDMDYPLHTAINLGNSAIDSTNLDGFNTIAEFLWEAMVKTNQKSKMDEVCNHMNYVTQQNILHSCAQNNLYELMEKICLKSNISEDVISRALFQPNVGGYLPLHLCRNESSVLKIMKTFSNIDFNHLDSKGNNLLHVYAKKNFVRCLKRIMKLVPDEDTAKYILSQKNHHGNNPLMSCVFKDSHDALNFLLCTLFTIDENNDLELMRKIIHCKNTKGETLLGLILNYNKGASMPEFMALQIEKMCHTEDDKVMTLEKFTKCLKENVEPSIGVSSAIHEVETSFEKTYFEKIIISLKLFLTSLIVPLGIMSSDMAFDLILVVAYSAWLYALDDSESASKYGCNIRNDTANEMDSFSNIEALNSLNSNIPSQLKRKPRFWYALAFIVFPWVFYGIEFFHSRHFASSVKKVLLLTFMFI